MHCASQHSCSARQLFWESHAQLRPGSAAAFAVEGELGSERIVVLVEVIVEVLLVLLCSFRVELRLLCLMMHLLGAKKHRCKQACRDLDSSQQKCGP